MTKSEYQDLFEFLGDNFTRIDRRFDAMDRRFDAIDRRFDAIDRRFDAIDLRFDAMEERLIRIEVLAEERHHQIRLVVRQLVGLQETMTVEFNAVRSEMAEGFGAVCSELRSVRPEKAASLDAQGRLLRVFGNRVRPLKA